LDEKLEEKCKYDSSIEIFDYERWKLYKEHAKALNPLSKPKLSSSQIDGESWYLITGPTQDKKYSLIHEQVVYLDFFRGVYFTNKINERVRVAKIVNYYYNEDGFSGGISSSCTTSYPQYYFRN